MIWMQTPKNHPLISWMLTMLMQNIILTCILTNHTDSGELISDKNNEFISSL